jgi:hypothetical protein
MWVRRVVGRGSDQTVYLRTPENFHCREDGLWSHSHIDGRFVERPPAEDIESWIYNGVAKTWDTDEDCEPDHPRSWLVVLGIF